MTGTIVATCGGWRPSDRGDVEISPLQLRAVELAGVTGRAPRVLYIGTAGGDQRHIESQELDAARRAGVEGRHLRLFGRTDEPLQAIVGWADVVWAGGGSVVNLLAVWRAHGLDAVLRDAWAGGTVLAGTSAGALCWHSGGTTSSFGPGTAEPADALGLLPNSLAVHYDSQPSRRPAHRSAVAAGRLAPGFALEEDTGIVYRGTRPAEFLTDRDGGRIHRIAADGGESVIAPELLR